MASETSILPSTETAPAMYAAARSMASPNSGAGGNGMPSPWRTTVYSLAASILIGAGAYTSFQYLRATKPALPQKRVEERAALVAVATVQRENIAPERTVHGTLHAAREIVLRMPVAGRIVAISERFLNGETVRKGEVLVEIDRFEHEGNLVRARSGLAEARARIEENAARLSQEAMALLHAQSELSLAKRSAQRASTLLSDNIISESSQDSTVRQQTQAQAAVDRARTQIEILQAQEKRLVAARKRAAWEVEQAERRLQDTRLTAPIDGLLAHVTASFGEQLTPNEPLGTLVNPHAIEARMFVPDALYARLSNAEEPIVGRPIALQWKRAGSVYDIPAQIVRVAAMTDAASGGYTVYARIDSHPDDTVLAHLRPGSYVEGVMADVTYHGVFAVPETALYAGDTVYRVREGRLEALVAETLAYSGSNVLVRVQGLADGDQLLISRLTTAGAGVRVRTTGGGKDQVAAPHGRYPPRQQETRERRRREESSRPKADAVEKETRTP